MCANVSEGRDSAVLARLAQAVEGTPGVELLDHGADPNHNRTVFTYVGAPEAVLAATQALCLELSLRSICGSIRAPPAPWGGRRNPIPLRGVSTEEQLSRLFGWGVDRGARRARLL